MPNDLMKATVSDLYNTNQLNFSRGRYNIIDCGTRTGKTYWAMHHLIDFTRDGQLNRILFMVDTLALKDSVLKQYGDCCCDADEFWKQSPDAWSTELTNKIGVLCYQSLGAMVIKEQIDWLQNIDVICWDECDSIFDFAATAFARARKTDFGRKGSTNGEILNLIQQHSTKHEYMSLIFLGFWEQLINENRILCIGLSATPEDALGYYNSLVSSSNQGKIDAGLRAATDIYFTNILEHVQSLTPIPGIGYWCYSPHITNNLSIVRAANSRGFHAIEIHSPGNDQWPMNEEQKRVAMCINELHLVPPEYDFVVITRAFERGLDITDARFKHVIIDSYYQKDRVQAARQTFAFQRHVKTFSHAIPECYKDKWLTCDECRELAEYLAIPDLDLENSNKNKNQTRKMRWNKLQTFLPTIGYTVEKARKRVNGTTSAVCCYKITGEWHDVEIAHTADFMQLVAAKNTVQLIEDVEISDEDD